MGSCLAAGFENVKVCCIRVSSQYHVAGSICDAIVWDRDNIIEDLVDGFIRVFRGHRLLISNVDEADEDFGVDRYGIVQQGSHYDLNMLEAFVTKFCAVIGVGHILGLGTIVDFAMFVR